MNSHLKQGHREYIKLLRRMSGEQRLRKAMELSELTRRLFKQGLRKRFSHLSEEQLHSLYLERLEKCHNRHY